MVVAQNKMYAPSRMNQIGKLFGKRWLAQNIWKFSSGLFIRKLGYSLEYVAIPERHLPFPPCGHIGIVLHKGHQPSSVLHTPRSAENSL